MTTLHSIPVDILQSITSLCDAESIITLWSCGDSKLNSSLGPWGGVAKFTWYFETSSFPPLVSSFSQLSSVTIHAPGDNRECFLAPTILDLLPSSIQHLDLSFASVVEFLMPSDCSKTLCERFPALKSLLLAESIPQYEWSFLSLDRLEFPPTLQQLRLFPWNIAPESLLRLPYDGMTSLDVTTCEKEQSTKCTVQHLLSFVHLQVLHLSFKQEICQSLDFPISLTELSLEAFQMSPEFVLPNLPPYLQTLSWIDNRSRPWTPYNFTQLLRLTRLTSLDGVYLSKETSLSEIAASLPRGLLHLSTGCRSSLDIDQQQIIDMLPPHLHCWEGVYFQSIDSSSKLPIKFPPNLTRISFYDLEDDAIPALLKLSQTLRHLSSERTNISPTSFRLVKYHLRRLVSVRYGYLRRGTVQEEGIYEDIPKVGWLERLPTDLREAHLAFGGDRYAFEWTWICQTRPPLQPNFLTRLKLRDRIDFNRAAWDLLPATLIHLEVSKAVDVDLDAAIGRIPPKLEHLLLACRDPSKSITDAFAASLPSTLHTLILGMKCCLTRAGFQALPRRLGKFETRKFKGFQTDPSDVEVCAEIARTLPPFLDWHYIRHYGSDGFDTPWYELFQKTRKKDPELVIRSCAPRLKPEDLKPSEVRKNDDGHGDQESDKDEYFDADWICWDIDGHKTDNAAYYRALVHFTGPLLRLR